MRPLALAALVLALPACDLFGDDSIALVAFSTADVSYAGADTVVDCLDTAGRTCTTVLRPSPDIGVDAGTVLISATLDGLRLPPRAFEASLVGQTLTWGADDLINTCTVASDASSMACTFWNGYTATLVAE